jgi:hypothetical protein
VVIALLAILAAATSVVLPRRDRSEVAPAAERLAAFLAEIRRASRRSGRTILVMVEDGGTSVVSDHGIRLNLSSRIRVAVAVRPDQSSTREFVAFFPDGSSSGGRFDLSNGEAIASIRVLRLTGRTLPDR